MNYSLKLLHKLHVYKLCIRENTVLSFTATVCLGVHHLILHWSIDSFLWGGAGDGVVGMVSSSAPPPPPPAFQKAFYAYGYGAKTDQKLHFSIAVL